MLGGAPAPPPPGPPPLLPPSAIRTATDVIMHVTNRFSKNLIKQTRFLPYNTPLKCTYPGTFIQIPLKVVGDFFEKSQNLKNLKIQKSKN